MGVSLCKPPRPRIKMPGSQVVSPSLPIPILPSKSKGVGICPNGVKFIAKGIVTVGVDDLTLVVGALYNIPSNVE